MLSLLGTHFRYLWAQPLPLTCIHRPLFFVAATGSSFLSAVSVHQLPLQVLSSLAVTDPTLPKLHWADPPPRGSVAPSLAQIGHVSLAQLVSIGCCCRPAAIMALCADQICSSGRSIFPEVLAPGAYRLERCSPCSIYVEACQGVLLYNGALTSPPIPSLQTSSSRSLGGIFTATGRQALHPLLS